MCRNGHGMLQSLIKQFLGIIYIGSFIGIPDDREPLAAFIIYMLASCMYYPVTVRDHRPVRYIKITPLSCKSQSGISKARNIFGMILVIYMIVEYIVCRLSVHLKQIAESVRHRKHFHPAVKKSVDRIGYTTVFQHM